MEQYLHIPSPPLSFFVQNIFYYNGYFPEQYKEKILPEGVIEIIVDLTDTPKRLYDSYDFTKFTTYRKSWISGQRTNFIVIEAAAASSMLVIRFHPGGTYPFFTFPISELSNAVTPMEEVIASSLSEELRSRVLEAPDGKTKALAAESFLLRMATTSLSPDPLLQYVLSQVTSSSTVLPVKVLADRIGISNKHLIEIFKKKVGLPPKIFSRISRFQKVIGLIHYQKEIDWADVAFQCGYYDQAHFIKDFHEFSGIRPTEYLSHKSEYINYLTVQ